MKRNKGISLIVLVITIIVMIILAGSIILSLSNNGIIGKANEAVDATNEASVRQLVELKWAEAYLDENVKKTDVGMYNAVMAKLEEEKLDLTAYYIEVTAKGTTVEKIPTVQELQSKYEFTYYSTFEDAISYVNNGNPSANSTKDDAEAGIYEDNGHKYVVLLKDADVESTVYIYKDMTLNLGGHKLSSNISILEIGYTEGKVKTNISIKANIPGSGIVLQNASSGTERLTGIRINNNATVDIKGGMYLTEVNTTAISESIRLKGSLKITNATMNAKNTSGESRALNVNETGILNMLNCHLETSASSLARTVYTSGDSVISNCKITADAKEAGQENWAVYQNKAGKLKITDCIIEANSDKFRCWGIESYTSDTLITDNCNITVSSKDATSQAIGIANTHGTNQEKIDISNCNIVALSESGLCGGVWNNQGTLTISNCNINAQDTLSGEARGISTETSGNTIIKNCITSATGNGLENGGYVEVYGGTYEGYLFGGMFFWGDSKTSYVSNATIRQCSKPDTYVGTVQSMDTGLYIGDSLEDATRIAKNIIVNMNNCNISGQTSSIKLSGTGANKLKISNSTIDTTKPIVIDDAMHKLYIGAGCNFNSENTNLEQSVVVESSAVYTK